MNREPIHPSGLYSVPQIPYVAEQFSEKQNLKIAQITEQFKQLRSDDPLYLQKAERLYDQIDQIQPVQTVQASMRVLDGTGHFVKNRGNPDKLRDTLALRMSILFQSTTPEMQLSSKSPLFALVQAIKKRELRATYVHGHGSSYMEYDSRLGKVVPRWGYQNLKNELKPVRDLLLGLQDEADVVVLGICNPDEITVSESPVMVYYNKGVLGLGAGQQDEEVSIRLQRTKPNHIRALRRYLEQPGPRKPKS